MAIGQVHSTFNIKDLVLWSDNPRDPIRSNATDQEIAYNALSNDGNKWNIKRLAKQMRPRYDFSELPTVVMKDGKPVVYDGNRRVLIGKIIHNLVSGFNASDFSGIDFPETLICNVCDEEIALEHIERKHSDSGSWDSLERDIFRHVHRNKEKTLFHKFEIATRLISTHPKLNKGFVKDEILTRTNLETLGFFATRNGIKSIHSPSNTIKILSAIVSLVENKQVNTRVKRGRIVETLRELPSIAHLLKSDHTDTRRAERQFNQTVRPTSPIATTKKNFLGATIQLPAGEVANMYSDILKLDNDQESYSDCFPMILRMSLRLLLELAAKDSDQFKASFFNDFTSNGFYSSQLAPLNSCYFSVGIVVRITHN